MPYELFLALRYLRFHRGRTFLSVITLISVSGVVVGTAALVIALSLMAGFVQDIRERIHSGSAHLTVMGLGQPTFENGDALIEQIENVDGVRAAGPVLHGPAMLMREDLDSPEFAEIHGIDPAAHARVILEPGEDDPFEVLDRLPAEGRAGIVLGEELARRVGVFEGDSVRVFVARARLAPWGPVPRSQVFEVVGTYQSDHFQEDATRAYVRLDTAQRLFAAADRISWVAVRLDDLRRLAPMKQRLREQLQGDWLVIDLIEQNQDLIKALNTEKLLLFLAIGLIVVVAALNIVSTLILMVQDKMKEIGTLRAMGASPRAVARVFMLQGLVIGTVGTLVGLALGVVVARTLDHYRLIRLDPDVYYLTYLPFATRPIDILAIGAAALIISLVATLYPAWKAARLDPVEAIRYE